MYRPFLICTVLFWITSSSFGQLPARFTETFDDQATFDQLWFRLDGSVVLDENGVPTGETREWGPSIFDLSQGNLHLQTTNPVPLSDPIHLGNREFLDSGNIGTTAAAWLPSLGQPVADAVLRTQVRVDTLTNAPIVMRANLATGSNYTFTAAGSVGQFAIARIDDFVLNRVEYFDGPTFNVGDDLWMEGSTIGDQLAMKVWKVGDAEPVVPQFRWTDDTYTAGGIALGGIIFNTLVPEPTRVDATFDNVDIRILDGPTLPTEFHDDEFGDFGGISPLGLPGNLNWSVFDSSVLAPGFIPREIPEAWGPAIVDNSTGALHIRSTNPVPVADPNVYTLGDTTVFPIDNSGLTNIIWNPSVQAPVADATVRTKVHLNTGSQQALLLRVVGGGTGYTFTASGATNDFVLARFDDGEVNRFERTEGLDLQVGDDWWMEASTIGDQISLWAWPDGEEKPDEPQISWTDDTIPGGFIAINGTVWTNNISDPTHVDVTYDDVSITGVTPFLFCAPTNELAGDLDGNGTVEFTDFLLLADNYGEQVETYGQGDIDCNGAVEFTDFLALSQNFGSSLEVTAAAAVPEPSSRLMCAFGLSLAFMIRRRRIR